MDRGKVEVTAKASDELAEAQNGWTCLAANPVKSEIVASGSQFFLRRDEKEARWKLGGVQLWNIDNDAGEGAIQEGNKR